MANRVTRVLLIFPRFNANSFWSFEAACALQGARAIAPPLGLITVAALLPQSWEFKLINRNAREMSDADILAADIVMTGGMLPQEPDTMAVIAACKRLGVPVAVGGPAATSTPEVYAHADFLFVGEAEGMIHHLVEAWERGEREGRFEAEKFKADVTSSPVPRFDLLDFDDYLWVNLQFSRGCPFTCEFCDIIELYGRAPRTKAAPQMLAELERLYELGYRGHVDFVDDNLIGNKKAIKLFLPHLIEWQKKRGYPFQFSTEASLNLADDAELLGLMRKANFFSLFVGIETPDEATLVQTSKKQNTRRSIAESVHRIYQAGMFVNAGFIVGFDSEGKSVAKAMADCVKETAIPTATIGLLTALPNTQLSRRLAREGRLFDGYRASMTETGDMCTAGLNFVTLRPRGEIWKDYRDTVAAVYEPAAFFGRIRALGRKVRQVHFRKGQKRDWRVILRDARTVARLCWAMSVQHPELARHYWGAVYDTLRHHPAGIEAVIRNVIGYLHLYPFSRFLVRTIDERIAQLEAGQWIEPEPLRSTGNTCRAGAPVAAVA
jgi:radical SAM superfamily enzyme YgiQ (UPF0313 family)